MNLLCESEDKMSSDWRSHLRLDSNVDQKGNSRRDWGAYGRFCQNGFYWPVLKHGPRSLSIKRVIGWRNRPRNESEYKVPSRKVAASPDLESLTKGSRKSLIVRTRKMVNYAWIGWSQGKLWWKLVAILTCKSFVKFECRGERLIEPSSSWFPPKFLSG